MKTIQNYVWVRNMMAHEPFGPGDDLKGVRFLVVKAKGRLVEPNVTWRTEDFESAYETIRGFTEALSKLGHDLRFFNLAKILSSPPTTGWPKAGFFGLTVQGTPLPLLQGSLGSGTDPATPETDSETPPKPKGVF